MVAPEASAKVMAKVVSAAISLVWRLISVIFCTGYGAMQQRDLALQILHIFVKIMIYLDIVSGTAIF